MVWIELNLTQKTQKTQKRSDAAASSDKPCFVEKNIKSELS